MNRFMATLKMAKSSDGETGRLSGCATTLPSTPHSNYSTTARRVAVNQVAMHWTRNLHSLFEGNRHEETQDFDSDPPRGSCPHVPERGFNGAGRRHDSSDREQCKSSRRPKTWRPEETLHV